MRFLQRPLLGKGRSWIGGVCLAVVGAFGLVQPAGPVAAAAVLPAFDHIFVVVMENRDYSHVLGDTINSPYVNSLAARYGVATNYYAVGRPSLPNYLALTGATTFGITTDCTDCFVSAPNIAVDRVEASGRTWKAYMESMPGPCFVGDSYPYMQKHDPFFYYDDIRTNPAECAKVVPYASLSSDLASAATTPNFVWVTPNMCDDTHDCPVAAGDQWLSQNIPLILNSPAFTTQSSALFLTWDEGDDGSPNQVPMVVVSPQVPAGFRSSMPATHYSLLKTIEAAWNLAPLGVADRVAQPMSDFFGPAFPPSPLPSSAPPSGPPSVSAVNPISGPSSGGTPVTVSGGGFGPGSVVRFGSVAARTVSTSAGAIVAAAPPGVGTVPVTVSTAAGTSAAGPSAAYTYTFANAPYSIDLSASPTSPAPGSSTTLVASASVDVGPTPYGISIFDTTAGAELAHGSSGSVLSYSPDATTTGTHRYVAMVANRGGVNPQAVAAPVVVAWSGPEGGGAPPAGPPPTPSAGDAVTLAASSLSPPVGAPVVLTATASRDVGPTPYGISIFDTTAGAELVHAGTGSSLAASVSRVAAATHSYVAKICNPGGVNAQASSVTVSVTWS